MDYLDSKNYESFVSLKGIFDKINKLKEKELYLSKIEIEWLSSYFDIITKDNCNAEIYEEIKQNYSLFLFKLPQKEQNKEGFNIIKDLLFNHDDSNLFYEIKINEKKEIMCSCEIIIWLIEFFKHKKFSIDFIQRVFLVIFNTFSLKPIQTDISMKNIERNALLKENDTVIILIAEYMIYRQYIIPKYSLSNSLIYAYHFNRKNFGNIIFGSISRVSQKVFKDLQNNSFLESLDRIIIGHSAQFDADLMPYFHLLYNKNIHLPQKWKREIDFRRYIKNILGEYRSLCNSLKLPKLHPEKNICVMLETTIEKYFKGKLHEAYDELSNWLKKVNLIDLSYLFEFDFPELEKSQVEEIKRNKNSIKTLFRARNSNDDLGMIKTSDNMFHIPFNQLHKVKPQRYSLQGFPCLYLGESSYICWEELGRPNINNFYLSSLKYDSNENHFIDLSWTPNMVIDFINEERKMNSIFGTQRISNTKLQNDLLKYLSWWPLYFICSIESDVSGNFKAEYIIPRLLLEYIIAEKPNFIGIKYFSSRIPEDYQIFPNYQLKQKRKAINYVIPAFSDDNEKLSAKHPSIPPINMYFEQYSVKLKRIFEISEPISYQTLLMMNPKSINHLLPEKRRLYGIELFGDYSIFDLLENALENLKE